MTRALYRLLLALHPPLFRREFSGEMLWIFDEAGPQDKPALVVDALRSLARQWLLRSDSWKVVVALIIAVFQVTLGGFGIMLFGPHRIADLAIDPFVSTWSGPHEPVTVPMLLCLTLFIVGLLVALLIFLNYWLKHISAKRLRTSSKRGRLCSNSVR